MRPKLEGRQQEIIQMFLDRRIFRTQQEVLEKALSLLLDHQVEEESKHWDEDSDTPVEHILSQVG